MEGKMSPGDTIRNAIILALKYRVSLIVPESNAYQAILKYWFTQFFQAQGISGIEVQPIYSGHQSKNTRILSMFKGLRPSEMTSPDAPFAVETHLHPDVRAAVFSQIRAFNPLKKNNVDGILDLLTYAPRIREEYGQFITWNSAEYAQEIQDLEVFHESLNSPF